VADNLDDTIRENAAGPAEVAIDGQSVKQRLVTEQIEADRYLASKQASKKGLGVKMTKVSPPGAF
jgi:hypothetical protein